MSKKINKKFYRPGTLEEKGTKISLKTQPYINGTVFDIDDPITSFHSYLSAIKIMIEEYEMFRQMGGADSVVPTVLDLKSGITGKAKLLLDYLIQSPIEINLKDQEVNKDVIVAIQTGEINNE